MSIVEFELAPLAKIEPWGQAPNLSLHWFGLSDGSYHLNLGATRLLEYTRIEGWPRFVDYQLARIHEDLIDLLPAVMEPIPPSTVRRFVDGSVGTTHARLENILAAQGIEDQSLDPGLEALGARCLDTLYLSPGAGIWIWCSGTKVVIEWDNRDRLRDGKVVWTALQGRFELDRDQFIEQLRSFDRRLMDAMGRRIGEVRATWSRADVQIDIQQLESEQRERGTWFEAAERHGTRATDWRAVDAALAHAERQRSG